ncbi:SDR family oxidoreductase [Caldilinea sp.]|uniref:SDR family oxidoreductase n=1 Tax=Caldilinea sp. TaxID=2293560 RepID=UPI002BF6D8AF|nr:SDR family oxidoreductase [Anaerolineales bacterium]HQY93352.1 SDR family oxidoreductase [Caldilinea sp.]HRA68352.1 SDR family oxidoreductase [Caldilinea sp.]
MKHDLQGKCAIITGGGRGIGRGIVLALAARGCHVAINYFRHRTEAEQTAADAAQFGVKAIVVKAHVGREEEIQALVRESATVLGSVDIFVGNAASGILKPITAIDLKAWEWTVNINARSILVGVQAALPYMRQQGWGRILTVTSIGSRRVFPEYGVVGVSKAAIESMTRYLAVELAPENIIANCISPGVVITGALDFFPRKEEMIAYAEANTPAGRLVTPADVGEVAAWLCSDAARMIVGQTIEVDGGYSLLAF